MMHPDPKRPLIVVQLHSTGKGLNYFMVYGRL
jgi:hypothetical protein